MAPVSANRPFHYTDKDVLFFIIRGDDLNRLRRTYHRMLREIASNNKNRMILETATMKNPNRFSNLHHLLLKNYHKNQNKSSANIRNPIFLDD
jgi:hypothetical protein